MCLTLIATKPYTFAVRREGATLLKVAGALSAEAKVCNSALRFFGGNVLLVFRSSNAGIQCKTLGGRAARQSQSGGGGGAWSAATVSAGSLAEIAAKPLRSVAGN